MKQIPNILTILRFILAGFFICFFLQGDGVSLVFATACFILAALSDWLDGYLARKYNVVSAFGKIMDPIADKFLMLSAFGLFSLEGIMPWWMFWVIAVREIGLTVFRLAAMAKGKVLAAERAGKVKTVLQMTTALVILFCMDILFGPFRVAWPVVEACIDMMPFLLYLTALVTLVSGISALWNNRTVFKLR